MSIFWCATVDLYGGLIVDPVDVIVDVVGSGSILLGYLSIIMSKIIVARDCGLNLQLRGRVQVYINGARPYCNTSCSLVICLNSHLVTSPIQECTAKCCTNWTLVCIKFSSDFGSCLVACWLFVLSVATSINPGTNRFCWLTWLLSEFCTLQGYTPKVRKFNVGRYMFVRRLQEAKGELTPVSKPSILRIRVVENMVFYFVKASVPVPSKST
jgi:hypothetical protein